MKKSFFVIFLPLAAVFSAGQAQTSLSSSAMWQDTTEQQVRATLSSAASTSARREIVPSAYRLLTLNRPAMEDVLKRAPAEIRQTVDPALEIRLPLPEGGFGRFKTVESPIMEAGLAAKYPDIRTYTIQGIDDPTASGRIDLTYRGLRATILSVKGRFFIDPYWNTDDRVVMSYYTRNAANPEKSRAFSCGVTGHSIDSTSLQARAAIAERPSGANLRTYRLALAATGEYTAAVSGTTPGTVAKALAAMVTSVNRVTAVYEREFAIRMILVNNTDKLIFINSASDPYSNFEGDKMLGQNQTTTDNIIGNANYDFGHVFSTVGGGSATLRCVCAAGIKARGVTGLFAPTGDGFDIDYVAHEMGHQFGASHTFNGTSGSAGGGNRNAATAFEPGSGSTIMAFAGVCAPQNLQAHSDDYFHSANYDEIDTYTTTGAGSNAFSTTGTGNTPPVVSTLPATVYIPSQTPFFLTASATDADGDALTYCWEEFDRGAAQDPTASPRDNGRSPIFRSYKPVLSPTRFFPSLRYILENANIPPAVAGPNLATGETLPTTSRTMVFRVSVRDNRAAGGGQTYASTNVVSVAAAGPFQITSPNTATSLQTDAPFTVNWSVASSDVAPINSANVKISYSADGGSTFPLVLASSTPNTGSAIVIIPSAAANASNNGRIKVEAVENIFFDIDDANLTVVLPTFANTFPGYMPIDDAGGTTALVAYALGGSPTGNNTGILPQSSTSGGGLQITFLARTNDDHLQIVVEASSDLVSGWTTATDQVSNVSQAGVPAGFQRQSWKLPDGARGFLRVRTRLIP